MYSPLYCFFFLICSLSSPEQTHGSMISSSSTSILTISSFLCVTFSLHVAPGKLTLQNFAIFFNVILLFVLLLCSVANRVIDVPKSSECIFCCFCCTGSTDISDLCKCFCENTVLMFWRCSSFQTSNSFFSLSGCICTLTSFLSSVFVSSSFLSAILNPDLT